MRVGVARLSNLRQLDTPEEGEGRPSRFGLNDRVRLLRLNWWENRKSGLQALSLMVRKIPLLWLPLWDRASSEGLQVQM